MAGEKIRIDRSTTRVDGFRCQLTAMADVQSALQRLLEDAIGELLPPELHQLARASRQRVNPTQDADANADFATTVPSALYSRLRGLQTQRGGAATTALLVSTTSPMGIERTRTFGSAEDVGRGLCEALPPSPALLAGAHAEEGVLRLTSRAHLELQRAAGKLQCAQCGRFLKGEKGLRDHYLTAHQGADPVATYEAAQLSVIASRQAVSLQCASAEERAAWAAAAEERRRKLRARDELAPGLAAARDGDVAALRNLVASGEPPFDPHTAADQHGAGALLWAAGGGHLDACRYLVNECALDARARGGPSAKTRRSALHWAARNGHLPVVQWLVGDEVGLDVDEGTADGTTAFHWAVWQGHVALARWLVDEAGCDCRSVNSFGCNAVQWCAQTGDLAMLQFVRGVGLDLGLLNNNGHSALHKAAVKGQAEACAWLLDEARGGLGAAHLRADGDGNTPAAMARMEGHEELAKMLELALESRQ